MSKTVQEWLNAYAEKIGGEAPNETEVNDLLSIAGIAAHSSERTAAPLTCYMIGKYGLSPNDALNFAKELESE